MCMECDFCEEGHDDTEYIRQLVYKHIRKTGHNVVIEKGVATHYKAAEQSVHPTLLTEPVNYCNPVNGVHAPFCTGHKSQSG